VFGKCDDFSKTSATSPSESTQPEDAADKSLERVCRTNITTFILNIALLDTNLGLIVLCSCYLYYYIGLGETNLRFVLGMMRTVHPRYCHLK